MGQIILKPSDARLAVVTPNAQRIIEQYGVDLERDWQDKVIANLERRIVAIRLLQYVRQLVATTPPVELPYHLAVLDFLAEVGATGADDATARQNIGEGSDVGATKIWHGFDALRKAVPKKEVGMYGALVSAFNASGKGGKS